MKLSELIKKAGVIFTFEIWSESYALKAVERNGDALQYVAEDKQTEAVCLKAVESDGDALRYVAEDKQTEAVCLKAVKRNGDALRYVAISKFEIDVEVITK